MESLGVNARYRRYSSLECLDATSPDSILDPFVTLFWAIAVIVEAERHLVLLSEICKSLDRQTVF